MAPHRRYSAKQKAEAVGIAVVEGVTETERRTGIPKETVHYWLRKPEFEHLRTRAREEVAEDFWTGVQVGLEEVTRGLRSDAPLRDKAQALGVVYDRFALLTGQATSRTESKALTEGLDDHERAQLRSLIDGALEAAAAATGGDPQ